VRQHTKKWRDAVLINAKSEAVPSASQTWRPSAPLLLMQWTIPPSISPFAKLLRLFNLRLDTAVRV
jgi:hypothetical protein